jgi:hypothetical protein
MKTGAERKYCYFVLLLAIVYEGQVVVLAMHVLASSCIHKSAISLQVVYILLHGISYVCYPTCDCFLEAHCSQWVRWLGFQCCCCHSNSVVCKTRPTHALLIPLLTPHGQQPATEQNTNISSLHQFSFNTWITRYNNLFLQFLSLVLIIYFNTFYSWPHRYIFYFFTVLILIENNILAKTFYSHLSHFKYDRYLYLLGTISHTWRWLTNSQNM